MHESPFCIARQTGARNSSDSDVSRAGGSTFSFCFLAFFGSTNMGGHMQMNRGALCAKWESDSRTWLKQNSPHAKMRHTKSGVRGRLKGSRLEAGALNHAGEMGERTRERWDLLWEWERLSNAMSPQVGEKSTSKSEFSESLFGRCVSLLAGIFLEDSRFRNNSLTGLPRISSGLSHKGIKLKKSLASLEIF